MNKFVPRNDYVLVRKVMLGETPSGIAVADGTIEGMEYRVVAVGPKVKGLLEDDRVLMIGTIGQDIAYLPNSRDLMLTKETNVALVYAE